MELCKLYGNTVISCLMKYWFVLINGLNQLPLVIVHTQVIKLNNAKWAEQLDSLFVEHLMKDTRTKSPAEEENIC